MHDVKKDENSREEEAAKESSLPAEKKNTIQVDGLVILFKFFVALNKYFKNLVIRETGKLMSCELSNSSRVCKLRAAPHLVGAKGYI